MGVMDWLFGVEAGAETRGQYQEPIVPLASISPSVAAWLGLQMFPVGEVTDERAMGLTPFWRGTQIISGTIAGLPLKTYQKGADGERIRVKSFLDNPAGPYSAGGLTPFAWKQLVVLDQLLWGDAFLQHIRNNGGSIIGLLPVPPSKVTPSWTTDADKLYKIARTPPQELDSGEMLQIMGMSMDGLRGMSLVTLFRQTFRTTIAGEDSAQRSFRGGLLSGLVTATSDVDGEEAIDIQRKLDEKFDSSTSRIAVVNRDLKFQPWSMSQDDAQFLQSRAFQVEEFSRMLGVPPHLLGQTEKSTSWGTGIAEQNLGLAKYTLMPITSRIEESLSTLLPANQFAEFDYSGLLKGTPQQEIELLIKQIEAGLITVEEARKIRNMPPLPKNAVNPPPTTQENDKSGTPA